MPDARDLELDERLWERVHACLDARRDPFDDAELARDLAARPTVELRVEALSAGLRRLPRPRRVRVAPLAAAALVVAALGVAVWNARPPPQAPARATTMALEVLRGTPPPPRGALRRLEPRPVLAWTYRGELP
jgi:hypothetical protein